MLASTGQPSLHGYDACMDYWIKGAPRRICREKMVRPLFLLPGFFCLVGIQGNGLGFNLLASLDWEGQASWATLPPPSCWC